MIHLSYIVDIKASGPCPNKNNGLPMYGDFHYKDKVVVRPFTFYTVETSSFWDGPLEGTASEATVLNQYTQNIRHDSGNKCHL